MKYSGFEKEEHFDRISFYNGDCMDLLKQTPDKYYDLALVDPPYGIDINMNMGRRKGEKAKHKIKQWDKGTPNDEYFAELMRISKNQIIWGGNYFALPLTGGWIFWNKNVPEGVSFADGELAWTSFKMVLKKINHTYTGFNGMDEGGKIHPTQKPVDLYQKLIKLYANENDKIIDTHLGSGSIAIAIDKANTLDKKNLTFVGIELDTDYYNAALNRFKNYKQQKTIFDAIQD
jgi:site-specific DNA-methyltransferase (adenine-specific)